MWAGMLPMNERNESRKAKQRGQGAIEAALVLLVFLVIVIGILDIGQVLFIHQALVERARNAVRYGIVRAYDATAITNVVLYNQPTVLDSAAGGFLGMTSAMINVAKSGAAGSTEERITVTIQGYPYQFFSPFIVGAFTARPIVASLPVETL
jgi:hypothetical protein